MGSWGTGIRDDDFVCDTEAFFQEQLKDGQSVKDASELTQLHFADALDDSDDEPLFWIALADMQLTYGELQTEVLQRVHEIIESDKGMERWGNPSEEMYED